MPSNRGLDLDTGLIHFSTFQEIAAERGFTVHRHAASVSVGAPHFVSLFRNPGRAVTQELSSCCRDGRIEMSLCYALLKQAEGFTVQAERLRFAEFEKEADDYNV